MNITAKLCVCYWLTSQGAEGHESKEAEFEQNGVVEYTVMVLLTLGFVYVVKLLGVFVFKFIDVKQAKETQNQGTQTEAYDFRTTGMILITGKMAHDSTPATPRPVLRTDSEVYHVDEDCRGLRFGRFQSFRRCSQCG